MASLSRILLAEEDLATQTFLADNLRADGYDVVVAGDRAKALALLSTKHPDLVLIDINGETLAVLDAVRSGDGVAGQVDPQTPILALSSRLDQLQRIRLLERGGDDVVSKPFSYPELRARIAGLLRRAQARSTPRMLRVGALSIDLSAHEVRVADRRVECRRRSTDFSSRWPASPRACSRKRSYFGTCGASAARCIHARLRATHIGLRRKLADAGAPGLVRSIWGVGLRLCESAR